MIITPDLEYPLVCVDVGRPPPPPADAASPLNLSLIDLNTGCPWYPPDVYSEYNDGTLLPQRSQHDTATAGNITSLSQIEKDAILVCYDGEWGVQMFNSCFFEMSCIPQFITTDL